MLLRARNSGVIRCDHVVKDTSVIIVVYLMSGTFFSPVRGNTRDWSKEKKQLNNNNKCNIKRKKKNIFIKLRLFDT